MIMGWVSKIDAAMNYYLHLADNVTNKVMNLQTWTMSLVTWQRVSTMLTTCTVVWYYVIPRTFHNHHMYRSYGKRKNMLHIIYMYDVTTTTVHLSSSNHKWSSTPMWYCYIRFGPVLPHVVSLQVWGLFLVQRIYNRFQFKWKYNINFQNLKMFFVTFKMLYNESNMQEKCLLDYIQQLER